MKQIQWSPQGKYGKTPKYTFHCPELDGRYYTAYEMHPMRGIFFFGPQEGYATQQEAHDACEKFLKEKSK